MFDVQLIDTVVLISLIISLVAALVIFLMCFVLSSSKVDFITNILLRFEIYDI